MTGFSSRVCVRNCAFCACRMRRAVRTARCAARQSGAPPNGQLNRIVERYWDERVADRGCHFAAIAGGFLECRAPLSCRVARRCARRRWMRRSRLTYDIFRRRRETGHRGLHLSQRVAAHQSVRRNAAASRGAGGGAGAASAASAAEYDELAEAHRRLRALDAASHRQHARRNAPRLYLAARA